MFVKLNLLSKHTTLLIHALGGWMNISRSMMSELMNSNLELGLREHSYSLCPRLPPLTPLLPIRYSKGENGGIGHLHFGEIAFT